MLSIGEVGAAVFLIALSFVDCSRPLVAVALLACSVTIFGSSYSGYIVNHMDIAPQYAGTLFGLTNCISAVSGFIAPYVAAVLTKNVRFVLVLLVDSLSSMYTDFANEFIHFVPKYSHFIQ